MLRHPFTHLSLFVAASLGAGCTTASPDGTDIHSTAVALSSTPVVVAVASGYDAVDTAPTPDGDTFLALGYGPNKGQSNHARFDLPAFNELFRRQAMLPDGPEREALIREAKKLGVAYMPYKISGHRIVNDLLQPWVLGYRRHPYLRGWWQYVDIDPEHRSP